MRPRPKIRVTGRHMVKRGQFAPVRCKIQTFDTVFDASMAAKGSLCQAYARKMPAKALACGSVDADSIYLCQVMSMYFCDLMMWRPIARNLALGLPVPFDSIGIKHGITPQNGHAFTEGLGNDQPIKGVFVIERQLGETLEVIRANPQDA
jgi:hypothetical protein